MRLPEILRRRLSPARRLEWFPPFRALHVKVVELSADWRRVRLLLPLRGNRNPGGGMFGGALACVADPIAALACNRVFPGHQVWTRRLTLDFVHESRTDMELRFEMPSERECEVSRLLRERGRATPDFDFAFYDQNGRACVNVQCTVAIRPVGYRPASARHRSNRSDD